MDSIGNAATELAKLVIGQTITVFVRCICAALAVSQIFLAWGPLFDHDSRAYQNPVFDDVFRFASPQAWGIGFALAGLVLLAAAISARAVVYLVGITLSSLTLAGWSSLIILRAVFSDEAVLTSGAIGLYVGTFTALIGLAASPRQLDVPRPLELVLDSADPRPIPLRRTGT